MSEVIKAGGYAGHGLSSDGTWDPGCTYKGYTEAGLDLPVTRAFVKYCRSSGIKMYTDETGGNMKNMVATVGVANRNNLRVYISFHLDFYKAPKGTLPIYSAGSKEGYRLAKCLNDAVLKYTPMSTRGLSKSDSLYEVTYTNMPAVIFELGSIKADLKYIRDHADDYGKALAIGLCNYLGVKFKEPHFTVIAKKTLIVRSGASLKSKKLDKTCTKGEKYVIVQKEKNRGKLEEGGWITITEKYVRNV